MLGRLRPPTDVDCSVTVAVKAQFTSAGQLGGAMVRRRKPLRRRGTIADMRRHVPSRQPAPRADQPRGAATTTGRLNEAAAARYTPRVVQIARGDDDENP